MGNFLTFDFLPAECITNLFTELNQHLEGALSYSVHTYFFFFIENHFAYIFSWS